jgi:hypothetical protein
VTVRQEYWGSPFCKQVVHRWQLHWQTFDFVLLWRSRWPFRPDRLAVTDAADMARAAIEDDALALHLIFEPREAWHRGKPSRGERTYVVRAGLLPAVGDVRRVGRVGMVGVVALYRADWLWEVVADGFVLRRFTVDECGVVQLCPSVRAATAADVVSDARPAEASPSTRYDAPAVFGLADVPEQLERLARPELVLDCTLLSSHGRPRCGTCAAELADTDCGQFAGVERVCCACVHTCARQAADARAAAAAAVAAATAAQAAARAAAARAATRAAASNAAAPVLPSAPDLMLLLDARALGTSLSERLACETCQGAVAHVGTELDDRRAGATFRYRCLLDVAHAGTTFSTPFVAPRDKALMAKQLLLGLCMAGVTVAQLETTLAMVGCQLPASASTLYEVAQPALTLEVAAVRNAELDARAAATAASGTAIVVGVDGTWSHCREASEATVIVLNAETRALLEVQHLLLRQAPSRGITRLLARDARVAMPRCSPKALEGLGAQACAMRLARNDVFVASVAKDDDSTSLAAVRIAYPAVAERLDRNHFLKAWVKVIQAAARSIKGLMGRAEHMRGHLQRVLYNSSSRPELFEPLLSAFLSHLQGDHSSCPAVATCANGAKLAGCTFHCILSCACKACVPKATARRADMAAHPRVARYGPLNEEVWCGVHAALAKARRYAICVYLMMHGLRQGAPAWYGRARRRRCGCERSLTI